MYFFSESFDGSEFFFVSMQELVSKDHFGMIAVIQDTETLTDGL